MPPEHRAEIIGDKPRLILVLLDLSGQSRGLSPNTLPEGEGTNRRMPDKCVTVNGYIAFL